MKNPYLEFATGTLEYCLHRDRQRLAELRDQVADLEQSTALMQEALDARHAPAPDNAPALGGTALL